jgi:hypothetical protein
MKFGELLQLEKARSGLQESRDRPFFHTEGKPMNLSRGRWARLLLLHPVIVIHLAVYLLLTSSFAQSGAASGSRDPKFSKESIARSDAQRERIKQELNGADLPDWAGDYYQGDGLGVNVDLTLAPKNGFVATWKGCLGLYDVNYGKVNSAEGKIRLAFTHANNHRGFEGFPEELMPVRWAERHYLIPGDKMIEFANEVNRGSEPRYVPHGLSLLKRGDEKKPATGAPALPAAYASYVLKQPIRTTIASVGSSRVAGDESFSTRHTQIVLSAGEAEGVKQGMEFYVYAPRTGFDSAKITKTEEHTSKADLEQDEVPKLAKEPSPAVGWKLSTIFEK